VELSPIFHFLMVFCGWTIGGSSSVIFVIRNGLRWIDAPAEYSPPKTIYNRFISRSSWACSTGFSPRSRQRAESRTS
jgi:transposase